jgi:hypothetical protein
MAHEEKRAWIMGVVSAVGFAVYVVVLLSRAGAQAGGLTEVAYVWPLVLTIVGAIVVSIVLEIAVAATAGKDGTKKDQRDREIGRFGEYVGHSFVVIGAVAALLMSMLELDHFWIANAVYTAFALSAVLGSTARIFAYRKGFHPW